MSSEKRQAAWGQCIGDRKEVLSGWASENYHSLGVERAWGESNKRVWEFHSILAGTRRRNCQSFQLLPRGECDVGRCTSTGFDA